MAQGIGGIQQPQLLAPKGGSFDIGLMSEQARAQVVISDPKPVFVRSAFMNPEALADDLDLSRQVDEQLNDLSSKGADADLIFLDARDYPDGCKASGTYQRKGTSWQLNGKVKCGGEETGFQISAATEADLKGALLSKVVELAK